jgi:hypothetical protein
MLCEVAITDFLTAEELECVRSGNRFKAVFVVLVF